MTKLAGNAHVYWEGSVYAPGDELPDELKHLADPEATDAPATARSGAAGGGATEVNGVAVNPEFDADKATVPELRDELKRLRVEFDNDDRKDALKAKYIEAVQA